MVFLRRKNASSLTLHFGLHMIVLLVLIVFIKSNRIYGEEALDEAKILAKIDHIIVNDKFDVLGEFEDISLKFKIKSSKILKIYSKYRLQLLQDDGYSLKNIRPLKGLIKLAICSESEELLFAQLEEDIVNIKLDNKIEGWGKLGYESAGSAVIFIYDALLSKYGSKKYVSLIKKLSAEKYPKLIKFLVKRPCPEGRGLEFINMWAECISNKEFKGENEKIIKKQILNNYLLLSKENKAKADEILSKNKLTLKELEEIELLAFDFENK